MTRTEQAVSWPTSLGICQSDFMAGDDMQDQNFFADLDLIALKNQAIKWFNQFQCIHGIYLYKASDHLSNLRVYIIAIVTPPQPTLSKNEESIWTSTYWKTARDGGIEAHEKALKYIKDPELRLKIANKALNSTWRGHFKGEVYLDLYKNFYKNPSKANRHCWEIFVNNDPHCTSEYDDPLLDVYDRKVQRKILFESPAFIKQRIMDEANGLSDLSSFVKKAKATGHITKRRLAHILGYDDQYKFNKIQEIWTDHELGELIRPTVDTKEDKIEAWYYILRRLTTGVDYRGMNLSRLSVLSLNHYAYVQRKLSYVKVEPDDETGAFIKLADLKQYFPEILGLPFPRNLYPREVTVSPKSTNEPGLEISTESAGLKNDELRNNPDDFLKGITIRFENDSQISIQKSKKPKKCIDLTELRFRDKDGIVWRNFLSVLKSSPNYYWKVSENREKKRIETVNERLVEWLNRMYSVQLPNGYKLYRRNKAAGKGIYKFTFNIEYEEKNSASKKAIKRDFFRLVERSKNENDPAKKSQLEEKIKEIAAQGLDSKVLSIEDVNNALMPGRQETEWKKLERESLKHE